MATKAQPVETKVEASVASEAPKLLTLDEYVKAVKVNAGTVASFKFEAERKDKTLLEPKTAEDWGKALKAQTKKIYE